MKIGIVGAGMGGLSAAVELSAAGHRPVVFEATDTIGGKVGSATCDGVSFDTGPSLLTLPHVLDALFRHAGSCLSDELELVRHEPCFRYHFPDGVVLDVHAELEDTLASVRRTLGAKAAAELSDFLAYARRIWEAAAPHFVFAQAPSVRGLWDLGALKAARKIRAIDPLETMWSAITRRIDSPHLRQLLARYATYNGSNPWLAPATLNCIAWVELGLGGFGVRGGMTQIAEALWRCAHRHGAELRLETPVRELLIEDGAGVRGLVTGDGVFECDAVVVNADVGQLVDALLPATARDAVRPATPPSMSGWTAIVRARRRPEARRPAHQVLFCENYAEEFADVFEHARPPRDPTVYVCAQEKAHARAGWSDDEPLFVMINAPPVSQACEDVAWTKVREGVMGRLREAGLIAADDSVVWERTPADLARHFPGSRGALYGAASNSRLAAFRRPPNRVEAVDGLFLASGSAHPGGGVPMCVQSGRLAAHAILGRD